VNQSVSFPPDLLANARRRALNLGMPFSAYVQKCIERDLAERGAIVFTESESTSPMAAEPPQAAHPAGRTRKPRR
jgi:hypothetical protein